MRKNKYKNLIFFIFLVAISIPILTNVIVVHFLIPKIESSYKEMASHFPKILDDLRELDNSPIFMDYKPTKNAQNLISKHISWRSDAIESPSPQSYSGLIELFEKYPKWHSDMIQLKGLQNDPNTYKINTSWMNDLVNYSHWDFSSHPKFKEIFLQASNLNGMDRMNILASTPFPSLIEFRQWGPVFFLQKYRLSRHMEGLQIFRKMAQLAYSTHTLTGSMVAVAMLKDEHFFSRNLNTPNWNLVPSARIQTFTRVSWAWVGLVKSTLLRELPASFGLYLKPEAGICAAAWESLIGVAAFYDFLEDKAPFEKGFSQNVEKARSFMKKLFGICNMKQYDVFVSRTPSGANPIFRFGSQHKISSVTSSDQDSMPINLSRVPYIRRMIVLSLISVASPEYMRFYEK